MPLKLFERVKNPATLFAAVMLILAIGLYGLFDLYLSSVSKEIAMGWIQSEAVAIQEGNLLSSVSKNQRVLLSSQFVTGIKLIDISTAKDRPLIEIGKPFDVSDFDDRPSSELRSRNVGFLHRVSIYEIPNQPNLVLFFDVRSDFLFRTYLATVAAFILFFILQVVCIRSLESKRIEAESRNQILLGEVAARVAHDIRSPLNTLNAVLETIGDLPPNSRKLLTTAIQRIREIGLGIADQSRLAARENVLTKVSPSPTSSDIQPTLLAPVVDDVVNEKRIQHANRMADISFELTTGSHRIFASVDPAELRRTFSNLIDNAIEASDVGQKIQISLSEVENFAMISIADEGKGIAERSLKRLGEKGFSDGKSLGTGLGVHYSMRAVKSWKGRIDFKSRLGAGTTVDVLLPVADTPTWFSDSIDLRDCTTIVVIDDDPTIHAEWIQRLDGLNRAVEHFFDLPSANSWLVKNRTSMGQCFFLTDFNLNSPNEDGMTLLERFGLEHQQALLVTDAFSDRSVLNRSVERDVRIVPKFNIRRTTITA